MLSGNGKRKKKNSELFLRAKAQGGFKQALDSENRMKWQRIEKENQESPIQAKSYRKRACQDLFKTYSRSSPFHVYCTTKSVAFRSILDKEKKYSKKQL